MVSNLRSAQEPPRRPRKASCSLRFREVLDDADYADDEAGLRARAGTREYRGRASSSSSALQPWSAYNPGIAAADRRPGSRPATSKRHSTSCRRSTTAHHHIWAARKRGRWRTSSRLATVAVLTSGLDNPANELRGTGHAAGEGWTSSRKANVPVASSRARARRSRPGRSNSTPGQRGGLRHDVGRRCAR